MRRGASEAGAQPKVQDRCEPEGPELRHLPQPTPPQDTLDAEVGPWAEIPSHLCT